eukprot:m.191177 g.191177  ORF g.191177 m.191177 type:complete len:74 (+) comp39441_c1_seq6:1944-2165(+)
MPRVLFLLFLQLLWKIAKFLIGRLLRLQKNHRTKAEVTLPGRYQRKDQVLRMVWFIPKFCAHALVQNFRYTLR